MCAETSATTRSRQFEVGDMFLLLLEQMQQMNGNITRTLSGDDHSSEPDRDDPADRGMSATQGIVATEALKDRTSLRKIKKNYATVID